MLKVRFRFMWKDFVSVLIQNLDGRGVGTNDVSQVRKNLKQAFDSGITQEYEWRMEQLGRLKAMIEENRKVIIDISTLFNRFSPFATI